MEHETDRATTRAALIGRASQSLLADLQEGRAIGKNRLRETMTRMSDGSDEWSWRDAYDAVERAEAGLLSRHGRTLLERAAGAAGESRLDRALHVLERLMRVERLEPKQSERTAEQVAFQQFSTPLPLAWCMVAAAGIGPDDLVLEPSAGTGVLAVLASWLTKERASVRMNELAPTRHAMLAGLLPGPVTSVDAERIDTEWDGQRPSVIVMNPPASGKGANGKMRRNLDALHTAAAWRALAPGGRLVSLTTDGFAPGSPKWERAFGDEAARPGVEASQRVDGSAFERRGTRYNARITIMVKTDRPVGADAPDTFAGPAEKDPAKILAGLLGRKRAS